ncbi:MAG: aspartate--tRNA ligase, partial [Candidatus Rokubacteria bacterium]|nr:aspartate--tRNA ligase [Candidatus Rokubacteria bacterium]
MSLGGLRRTHSCGALRAEDVGREVTLMGWAFRRRDHGGLIFVDLRDREGVTQCVFNPATGAEAHAAAGRVRGEYVLAVRGTVQARPPGTANPQLPTGEIEVAVGEVRILNESKPLPFPLEEGVEVDEAVRLRYRYLDLRRPRLLRNFLLRDRVYQAVRASLHAAGFVEVETPFLTRSTPEGARDFLVPSRLARGHFYALPQSPQLFKQILMVAGLERYFQIVRCFRDEDLRRDRQPEFTQIDIETAFLDRDDFLPIVEGMIVEVFQAVRGIALPRPFPRLGWDEARARYGSDKPDLRFGLELADCSDLFRDAAFEVFAQAVHAGGVVKALRVPGAGGLSRRDLDGLVEEAKGSGARGMVWVRLAEGGPQASVALFRGDSALTRELAARLGAQPGDLLLLVADAFPLAAEVLGRLRAGLAARLGLIPADLFRPCWVLDFPLLEWSEEEKRWQAMHHPFTAPRDEDVELLWSEPGRVRAKAYDLVLNGQEIGGGSIRIHERRLQQRMFEVLGIGETEARAKFGFLLEALEYGAPPHGGIALGLDRLVA